MDKTLPSAEHPTNVLQCYQSVIRNYFNFKGRTSRYEYWSFFFINSIVTILMLLVDYFTNEYALFSSLYTLFVIIPFFSVGVRRLHDINKRGIYLLVPPLLLILSYIFPLLIPVLGKPFIASAMLICSLTYLISFIIIIYWLCKKSYTETNAYGSPLPAETPHQYKVFLASMLIFLLLPILSILAMGIISGYSKASLTYKTNNTIDQISTLVTNIRRFYAPTGSYKGLNNAAAQTYQLAPSDMFGSSPDYLVNPFGGAVNISTDGQLFSIIYLDLPQENCRQVFQAFQNMDGLIVAPDSCSDCVNNLCGLQLIGQ